jgi:hypothetical protein
MSAKSAKIQRGLVKFPQREKIKKVCLHSLSFGLSLSLPGPLEFVPRAVNEPSEPSFWQNRLGSLVRKYIRAGPELEPSLKSNAQTRLNREIICSGSSLGSPKRDTQAEPSTRVARLDSSSGNRPQFVGQNCQARARARAQ